MASTYLTRTTGTPTSGKKYTWSAWVKRSQTASHNYIFSEYRTGNDRDEFGLMNNDTFRWESLNSGNNVAYFQTNRLFRDCNAWYHFVFAYDSTLATSTDRWKFYVNGVQETSFSATMYPAQNAEGSINISGITQNIGQRGGSYGYLDGSMSHFHFCDGTALSPTVFGETDSTTGEWKIKTSPSFTLGNNGFTILKDGNTITDQSSNSNNFSLGGGTLTKTEDNPSNVFATLNPLVLIGSVSFTAGNTKFSKTTGSYWRSGFSTLGMTSGKYYFEVLSNAGANNFVGARDVQTCDGSLAGNNDFIANVAAGYGLYSSDGKVKGNSNTDLTGVIGTFTDSDYIGCFLDLDNNKLYFSKNGTMLNTTGVDIASGKTYLFGVSGYDSNSRLSCNFGNGAFDNNQLTGTTYNGADGNGIFKYNPNNITLDGSSKSFKSLSTKGLNL